MTGGIVAAGEEGVASVAATIAQAIADVEEAVAGGLVGVGSVAA